MIINIIVLFIILIFGYMGYRRGAVITLLGILGLVCSYIGAYLLFRPFGNYLQIKHEVPLVPANALGGFVVFLFIYLVFKVISFTVSRARKKRAKEEGKAGLLPVDKWLGGLLGGTKGLIVVVVLFCVINLMKLSPAGEKLPDVMESYAGKVSATIIQRSTYAVVEQITDNTELSNAIAYSVSDFAGAVDDLKKFLNHPRFKELADDSSFQDAIMREDKEELMANPALNEFLNDPEILEAASNFGLISPGQDTNELANEAAETLTGIGSNFKKIQNDPEIRRILQDKDIEMKLENQDIKGLIMDSKFNELVNRVLELLEINKRK